ncbi:radical SAM protein [Micromonospora tarapacensis]|uniref:radical SAM protein n=1 Tax=Micromonospora tarapacensis TaxID=2835305 RepID=UPI001E3A7104|nr:radical SAM protein [Micromonospora tarapacensis]
MTADLSAVTLLWALRSPCNLGCRYCYFGTIEEHREAMPQQSGAMSHLARTDLDLTAITAFAHTLPGSRVKRIFIAGGEPLIWPPVMEVIAAIKAADVQVVLCTNGIPLNRPELVDRIITLGVDAVVRVRRLAGRRLQRHVASGPQRQTRAPGCDQRHPGIDRRPGQQPITEGRPVFRDHPTQHRRHQGRRRAGVRARL